MFTDAIMQLSGFDGEFGMTVVRDCAFSYVGKVPTALPCKLVPCGKLIHLREAAKRTDIAGVVTTPELAAQVSEGMGLAVAEHPRAAVYALHAHLVATPGLLWKDFETEIAPDAVVEDGAVIASRNVRIGARSVIAAGAIVRERTIIGSDCWIGNNVVLAGPAYEVESTDGLNRIMPQAGGVWIEDNVEILPQSAVARSTFGGFTRIGAGTKMDNFSHIGHDCNIGRDAQIVSGAMLAGRVTVGDRAFVGSNAVIGPGLVIGADARVSMGAVVVKDVREKQVVSGHFAVEHMKWLRFISSALR